MDYIRKVLPNGLRLFTVPMQGVASATTLVMVGAGSRYETAKNSGISHFLEHMAFKGTKRRPSAMDISGIVDGIGGEFNAFTSKETTGYYIKSAANHVDLGLDLLSDMLQNSKLDPVEIDKERGVILEEINLYEDTPSRHIGDIYERLLYGDTPMGWDIAGDKDIIRKITHEDFVAYMKSLYSPHNMTVVVAGGVSAKEVEDQTQKYFGGMKRFDIISPLLVEENQKKPQVLVQFKKTEQVHLAIGVRTFPVSDPRRYPISVLSTILGGGMSSRLFHEVREKRGLGYYVRTHGENYKDVGSLVTTTGVDSKRVDEAIEVILSEYRDLSTGNAHITKEELIKAKEYLKGHLVLELEDSRSVAGFYASQELLEDEIEDPAKVMKQIDAVTIDQVVDVAKDIFKQHTLNLAVIGQFEEKDRFEKLLSL